VLWRTFWGRYRLRGSSPSANHYPKLELFGVNLFWLDPFAFSLAYRTRTSLQAVTNLWNRCVVGLQEELSEQQFNTWIRPLHAVEDGNVLRLLAPNRFVVDWLQQHYIERISQLIDGAGSRSEVVVEVGSRKVPAPHAAVRPAKHARPNPASVVVR